MKETVQNTDKRTAILEELLGILTSRTKSLREKAAETMKSKAGVDGPWQSKQPDEMIKLEVLASGYQQQADDSRLKEDEVRDLLSQQNFVNSIVRRGSIMVWEIQDPDRVDPVEETVILTDTGGGELGPFRLLSTQAPLSKALLGAKMGQTVTFGEINIKIKELI